MSNPRVTDNDKGEITVTFNGRELRGWSYKDDTERRTKMLAAREYVEGWCDRGAARNDRRQEKKDAIMWSFHERKTSLAQARAQLKDLGYEQWEIDLFIDGDTIGDE